MNWLGFSLSLQQQQQQQQQQQVIVVGAANHPSISDPHHPNHHHHQVDDLSDDQTTTLVSRLGFNYSADETDVSAGGNCFDLSSHDDDSATTTTTATTSTAAAMNHLPPSFGMLHHHHHPSFPAAGADWNMKSANDGSYNYKSSSNTSAADQHLSMSMLMDNHHHHQQQQPKLENFLGGRHSFLADPHHPHLSAGHGPGSSISNATSAHHAYTNSNNNTPLNMSNTGSAGSNNNIGLSMIKTWLRNQPAPTPPPAAAHPHSNQHDKDNISMTSISRAQTLSLSMSTGADAGETTTCPSAAAGTNNDNNNNNNNKPQATITIDQAATATDDSLTSSGAAVEAVPKKSIDTFGQRTSIYRGVTRHRWTGRYEAHLWDNSCRREGQTRKGRQVYLGGYDKEEKAARAYDLAALKYWGTTTTTNFPMSNYEKEVDEMKHMTRQEYVASLRRKSSGFSRGASIYRGVTRHHQHGRWQARIGRVAGNKDLYLGTFSTQEEAAEAYDIAAIKFRGLNAVTNFDMNRYDVKSILESSTLPIGGAAKRLKDAEQARHYSEMTLLVDGHNRSSSLTTDNDQIMMSTSNDPYHQQLMMMRASTSDHHHNYSSSAAASGWPTLAFNQAAAAAAAAASAQAPVPFHGMQHYYSSVMPAYSNDSNINGHRVWCKQEQDVSSSQSFYQQQQQDDLHHHQLLQLGGTHNFFQLPGGGLMEASATTHDSMEHSSGSNSVIYGSTGTTNGAATMAGGGDHMHAGNSTNMIPMASVAAANNDNGFGDADDHDANYMNNLHVRNHLYYPPPQPAHMVKGGGAYDEDHSSNWVPTAVPTTTTPTFTFWSDT